MAKIKVGQDEYNALSITGKMNDKEWDGRQSKTFRIEATHEEALEAFTDGCEWAIVDASTDESGNPVEVEFDNAEFSLAGDVTDHRDGTVSVTMGKLTDLEEVLEIVYGGGEE